MIFNNHLQYVENKEVNNLLIKKKANINYLTMKTDDIILELRAINDKVSEHNEKLAILETTIKAYVCPYDNKMVEIDKHMADSASSRLRQNTSEVKIEYLSNSLKILTDEFASVKSGFGKLYWSIIITVIGTNITMFGFFITAIVNIAKTSN